MSIKNIIILIIAIAIIAAAWVLLDHRSGYPKSVEQLQMEQNGTISTSTATSTNSTLTTSTAKTDSNMKNFQHIITIETSKGSIVFQTYDADAPKAVANFISLINKGFYNGLIFHRVIEGFMIQGGDPTGTGMGGPGYKFADELNPSTESFKTGYVRGTVAMANSGPDTNGSQFFIVQGNDVGLEHKYTIFGKVISGMDVVDAIANVKTDGHPQDGGSDKPLEDVKMIKVTVATSTN